MAKELLPGQELHNGRFRVLKTLSFGEDGGVYTVNDTELGQTLLLREVIPPPSLDDEELERRKGVMEEALLILTQFEHEHLSKIYLHFSEGRRQYIAMERVDGITLKTLIEMSVKPLPEEQVLGWAISLCEALHYLHDRPKPFVFDVIDPTHIMMTAEENLKLINYGVDRFFLQEDARGFTASREDLAVEMKRFAETLVFLLTRKPPGPFGVSAGEDNISEPLVGVINRLLAGDPARIYSSYAELSQALDKVLHPPPPIKAVPKVFEKPWVVLLDFNRMWQDALWAYLKQPLYMVVLELLGVIVLFAVLWAVTHPVVHPREGPAAYVACGKDLYVVGVGERKVQTRVVLDHAISALAAPSDGRKLFAAAPEAARLYIINTLSNRVMGWVPVEREPQKLLMDPSGQWLYVLHPQSGQVGFVQVDPAPLPLEVEGIYRPKDTMVGQFAAGANAQGMALGRSKGAPAKAAPPSPAARPGAGSPAASPAAQPEAFDRLYVTSEKGSLITLIQPNPLEIILQAQAVAPGPAVLNPSETMLYVGQGASGHILTFQVSTLKPGASILDVGGTGIRQLLFTPDGSELWVVNRSGTIGVINPQDRKVRSKASLGGEPSDACFRQFGKSDLELWVALESTNEVVVVNPLSRTVKDRISVGGSPRAVWVVP